MNFLYDFVGNYSYCHFRVGIALRLIFTFMIINVFPVNAVSHMQHLDMPQARTSIKNVFRTIKVQTGFDVVWDDNIINSDLQINADFRRSTLDQVMERCLQGTQLSYTIDQKSIVIHPLRILNFKKNQDSIFYSGRVVDREGQPLGGATIRVKFSPKGVYTDAGGYFKLKAPSSSKVNLLISFVGFINAEITVSPIKLKLKDIQLLTATQELGQVEIVSNGYQDFARERSTGSFEQVTSLQLQHSTNPNLLKRLEGITTAVNFNNVLTPTIAGAQPIGVVSSVANITIRGRNTLNLPGSANSSGQPLVVIDGVASAYDMSQLDPNDVESVTILKDAAAASIWGSRAANGVFVIKTKRGNYNRPLNISFNGNIAVNEKPDLFYRKRMSISDFIDAQRLQFIQSRTNLGSPSVTNPQAVVSPVAEIMDALINKRTLSEAEANLQLDVLRSNDVRDDIKKYLLREAVNQNYSLGISGGSQKIAQRLSSAYSNSISNTVNNNNQRLTFTYNVSIKPLKNLELQGTFSYTQRNTSSQATNTYVGTDPQQFYPYASLADQNGTALSVNYKYRPSFVDLLNSAYGSRILNMVYKPLEEKDLGSQKSKEQGYNLNLNAIYNFSKSFSGNIIYSYNRFTSAQEIYYSKDSYYMRELINRFTDRSSFAKNIPVGGLFQPRTITTTNKTVRGQLNFNQFWKGGHSLNAIAGVDVGEGFTSLIGNQFYGYNPETLLYNNSLNYAGAVNTLWNALFTGQSTALIPAQPSALLSSVRGRTFSSYANAAYNYQNRYTLSASIRRDGSNALGMTENISGKPFYSFGTRWNIAAESFYNLEWLSILSLRSTFGYNGNTNPLTFPKPRITYSTGTGVNGLMFASAPPDGNEEASNSKLRPERTGVLNFGLDWALKDSRFNGSFEYYVKNTKDLITSNTLDPSTGFTRLPYNTGDLHGYGIDMILNSQNLRLGNFSWSSNLLFSYNRVKVVKLYVAGGKIAGSLVAAPSAGDQFTVGNDLNRLFAFSWAGLDPQTGNPRIFLNGQPVVISDGSVGTTNYNLIYNSAPNNAKYIGSSVPVYFGSIRNTFNYGSFSVSANILYKLKYFIRRPAADLASYSRLYQDNIVLGSEFAYRWQRPGDELRTNVPSLTYPGSTFKDSMYRLADINILKGDHIRLQEINLSYRFSSILGGSLKSPRIYGNIDNLGILWRANRLGIDPDINDVPQPRTYSFGFSANF